MKSKTKNRKRNFNKIKSMLIKYKINKIKKTDQIKEYLSSCNENFRYGW